MYEVFVEGNKVDVNQEFSVALTLAIDDIKDFGAKNTTVSKTIIFPGTKNNNKLFGNIFEISGSNNYDPTLPNAFTNFNASVSARFVMFNGNIQCMKGVMQMLQIVIDGDNIDYEIGFFGELSGLVTALGNNKLEDLDFSAYDCIYDAGNIAGSWAATPGYGIFFPLIDYGTFSTNKHDWDIRTFRPALYVKEYIDKIFSNSKYTYECDLFSTSRFKSLIIPHASKIVTRLDNNILNVNTDDINWDESSYSDGRVSFPNHPTLAGFTSTISDTLFTYTEDTGYSGIMNLHLTGSWHKYASATYFVVEVYKNLIVVGTFNVGVGSVLTGTYDETLTFPIVISTGDGIYVKVSPQSVGVGFTFTIDAGSELKFTISDKVKVSVNPGDTLTINNAIPLNIFQKDFISSICKLFNLMIYEDPNKDKHLVISPFVDFFNLATSIDWTYKVDRSQPRVIKPMSELNARYYLFSFKEDSDYYNDLYKKRYNETYGSYLFDSTYQFSIDSQKIELIFSGTPLVGYNGQEKVYSTIFKRSGTVEEVIDSNIRILQAKKVTGVTNWTIKNGVTNLLTINFYGYAGHFDDPDAPSNDLNFGVPYELFFTLLSGAININQFNVYWSSYMAEITDKDSKMLTAKFKLTLRDIANIDFSKYIHIDGSLFRINKIIEFNASKEDTCEVELIKVINQIY